MARKSDNKARKWRIRKQKKTMRQLSRKKNNRYTIAQNTIANGKNKAYYRLQAPAEFSLSINPKGTVEFFAEVFRTIKNSRKRGTIYFDLQGIIHVTPDAIMYLIAVITNYRLLRSLELMCVGNMPINSGAKKCFEKVGFYDYVRRAGKPPEDRDGEKIRIRHGRESDVIVASRICDFVNEKIESDNLVSTKRLYSVLGELMINVKQHAYNGDGGAMSPRWYVYVENCEENVEFVFLDTGAGIPSTIRRNWMEVLRDSANSFIGSDSEDARYIEAALYGEFRTETKCRNRGKGLPEIREAILSESSSMNCLQVYSGKGICKIQKKCACVTENMETNFEGTLFMWRFEKERRVEDDRD